MKGLRCIGYRETMYDVRKPGSIILLHNGAKYTVEALEEVILTLVEVGYELVPVSELMYQKKYVVDSMGRQVVK